MKRKHKVKFIVLAVILFGCLTALYFQINYKKTSILEDITDSVKKCDQTKYIKQTKECLKNTAYSLIQTRSLKDIMTTLQENPSINLNSLTSECHIFTHYLGQAAYKKNKDFPSAILACNTYCYSGCYHGVTQEYIIENYSQINTYSLSKLASAISKGIPADCRENSENISSKSSEICTRIVHGVGHGLIGITNQNLPESLKICDNVSSNIPTDECYSGAFMDNSANITSTTHPSKYFDPNNPSFPCTILDEKYQKSCYENQENIFFKDNIEKNVSVCNSFPKKYQEECYKNVAKNNSVRTRDIEILTKDCNQIQNASIANLCRGGIIRDLGEKYINDYELLLSFCANQDEKNKISCYTSSLVFFQKWGLSDEKSCVDERQFKMWCK